MTVCYDSVRLQVSVLLLRQIRSQRKKCNILGEIITCDPQYHHTMEHPDLTVSNFMEHSIGHQRVNRTVDTDTG